MIARDLDRVTSSVNERTAVLAEFVGTPCHRQLLLLLEEMQQAYLLRLADVSPEELARPQNALRQVMALHAALSGAEGASALL